MNVLLRLAVTAIRLYQFFSRYFPRRCRFYPPCSEYVRQGMERHGLAHGTWLGIKRLLRCHPWHPGGYDPLPGREPGTGGRGPGRTPIPDAVRRPLYRGA